MPIKSRYSSFIVPFDRDGFRPWYKYPAFKRELSASEIYYLDSMRMLDDHPAAKYHDLPPEVQGYISELEDEYYIARQSLVIASFVCILLIGLLVLFSLESLAVPLPFGNAWGASLAIVAFGFLLCVLKWRRNRNIEWPEIAHDRSYESQTQERIKQHWERQSLYEQRREPKEKSQKLAPLVLVNPVNQKSRA